MITEKRQAMPPSVAPVLLSGLLGVSLTGCVHWGAKMPIPTPPPPLPLGHAIDPHFQKQEEAGEAQDFVIYDHEFYEDSARLTADGEAHLRQIAARAIDSPFPIVVEMSQSTPDITDKHDYPISLNPELDMRRQQVVVRSLAMMGVPNAHTRVVVAPALSAGFTSFEGERAYNVGIGGFGMGGGGGGGAGRFGGFGF